MWYSNLQRLALPIIAVAGLLAILACVVGLVRGNAAMTERKLCGGNLAALALALQGYEHTQGMFPPGTLAGETLAPEHRLSWVPLVLTWTDFYQGIHFLFERDQPWDSEANLRPRIEVSPAGEASYVENSTAPPWFRISCRSNPNKGEPGMPDPLHYVGIAGLGIDAPTLPSGHRRAGVFGYDRQTRAADIKDGLSNTMMLAETTANIGPWTAGGPASVRGVDNSRRPYIGRGAQFGGAHRGGAMVAFADGSVRFVSETINPQVFEAISTKAGGEALPAGWMR